MRDVAIERSSYLSAAAPVGSVPKPMRLAVVVPTLNERDNIVPLLAALDSVLGGYRREILFVDDWSTDGTAGLIASIARARPDVRLIHRHGRRGLSSAVIEGMLATTADIVAVIDADMQHDEALLPQLCALIEAGETDIAVGSRYVAGGSVGEWCSGRRWLSRSATRLADIALPVKVADPMSGYFVLRRETFLKAVPCLSGKGFKLLLDIILSVPATPRIMELPYTFRNRMRGESKLGWRVMAAYLRLLAGKLVRRHMPGRLVRFGLVGTLGIGVHLLVLRALLRLAVRPFAVAQAGAVIVAIAFNFLLNNRLTFPDRALRGRRLLAGLASFYAVCSVGAAASVGVASLAYAAGARWWAGGVAGAVAGAAWNFLAASRFTWACAQPGAGLLPAVTLPDDGSRPIL